MSINKYNMYSNYSTSCSSNLNKITLNGLDVDTLNWNQFSSAEILCISDDKTGISDICSVSSTVEIIHSKLIKTPISSKTYSVALLDSNGNPVYQNGIVAECPCNKALEIRSNEEGSYLSGRKLLVSGNINQTITYTANTPSNPVNTIRSKHPFDTYIILYPKFSNVDNTLRNIVVIDPSDSTKTLIIKGYAYTSNPPIEIDMNEDFNINIYIEDTFFKLLDRKTIYKSISLFLSAKPDI